MTTQAAQVLGLIGTLIVAIGYLPQIVHIAREGCSAGISVKAWYLWLLSSVLVFAHAFMILDVVFLALQTVNVLAIATIIVLAKRYEHAVCKMHARQAVTGDAQMQ